MIYGVRSNEPWRACTRIEYKGHEISIAMDDGNRGRDLTRASIIVYMKDQDVTANLATTLEPATAAKITPDGIIDPKGEDLLNIMMAIDKLMAPYEVPDSLNEVQDRETYSWLMPDHE